MDGSAFNSWSILNDKNYVTPEMFGAVGDGVTDDTESLQSTIFASQGKTVYIPSGKIYAFSGSSPLIIPSYTNIRFDGTIKVTSALNASIYFFDPENAVYGYDGMHDITIVGTGVFDASGDSLANAYATPLRIIHCTNICISGITIKNYSKYHAIEISGSKNIKIDSVKFQGMYINGHTQGTFEAIQIERISEAGSGGSPYYDGTVPTDITITNCYFGPSEEGGEMYTAIGSDDWINDPSKGVMFENILIQGCTIENLSWKPNNQSVPLSNPYYSAICLDSNFRNVSILNCMFKNIGVGIPIGIGQYSDNIVVSGNRIIDAYGTAIAINKDCSDILITNNYIDGFGQYNEDNKSYNATVGIYVGINSYDNVVVRNNVMKSSTTYSTLPVHIPSVGFTDFGDICISDNTFEVLDVVTQLMAENFQNNLNRYNRDNTYILYNEPSTGIYLGSILFDKDVRIFKRIEIVYSITNVGNGSKSVFLDQLLVSGYFSIRDFDLDNNGTSTDVSFYEMNLSTNSDYRGFTINSSIRVNVGTTSSASKYVPEGSDIGFMKILSIRGYLGNNYVV